MTSLHVSKRIYFELLKWFENFQYVSDETRIEYFEWFKDILLEVLKTIFFLKNSSWVFELFKHI